MAGGKYSNPKKKLQKVVLVKHTPFRKQGKLSIPRGIMKKSMKGTLKYSQAFTSTAFPVVDQVFRLNSIFDPDLTNVGHQPYGRDQYATLYNRYRVDRVSWNVQMCTTSATGQMIVVPNNASASFTSPGLARETPRAQWKGCAQYQDKVISGGITLYKLNGVTKKSYEADDRFQSVMGTSPSEIMDLHVLACTNADTSSVDIYYTVTLTYSVTFYDPIPFSQS